MTVAFDTVELAYWALGSAFVVYLCLRLFATFIGNKW